MISTPSVEKYSVTCLQMTKDVIGNYMLVQR